MPLHSADIRLRLHSADIRLAGELFTFTFDGSAVTALPGETVAAALIAAGHVHQRTTQQDQPRGVFCGMGVCYDCLLTIDGKASQRACLTPAAAGMQVTRQPGLVQPDNTGAPLAPAPEGKLPQQDCELLIIGAGPGGLSAAVASAEAGVEVIIADERPYPGGQYFKPLAPSYKTAHDQSIDEQFAAGRRLVEKVRSLGVTLLSETPAWGGWRDNDGRLELGIVQNNKAQILRPKQLIIATGAYERPLSIPGWTLPGVMTTGAAQTLARSYRVAPGERILIAGNGPLNLQVACELLRGGVQVIAVIEAAASPWQHPAALLVAARYSPQLMIQGLGYLRQLKRHGVDILYQHVLTRLDGSDRVESATVGRLSVNGLLQSGSERHFDIDAVCMGYGFLPSTELARQLGCKHRYSDSGIGHLITDRDESGQTSQPDVFVVGEAGVIGGAQIALQQGRLAGCKAAAALGYPAVPENTRQQTLRQLHKQQKFQQALWQVFTSPQLALQFADADTLICRCEEITLGRLQQLVENGITHIGALKRLTRAGMGRCQGRYCSALLQRLISDTTGRTPTEFDYFAPQIPLKPVPATLLAVEKPEWGGHRRSLLPAVAADADEGNAKRETDVLVIGAGIAGCSSAYFLARTGRDVLLVDKGEPNAQASGANAGSLHVQLLSFDYGARAEAGGGPAAATLKLQKASVALWQELQMSLQKDFEINISGGLMLAENERDMAFLKAKIALERQQGIEVELIDRYELQRLAPAVSERMIGAAFCSQEGKINPLTATTEILSAALVAGARLEKNTAVIAIEKERHGFKVTTSRGTIRCGRIVNAAGAWAGRIAAMAGIDLPVHGAPLQMIVTEPAAPLIDHLIAHADRHLTMKQVAGGNLIIGGGWSAGLNQTNGFPRVLRSSLEGNLWIAQRVIPAISQLHILRSWAAMNVNIDGAPVLGEVPGIPGFYNAVTSNGYTLGPMMGRLTAELISGGDTGWDLTPFTISRFVH